MDAYELLSLIGDTDDVLIEEAGKSKRSVIPIWTRAAAAAVCLCLAAAGIIDVLLRFDYFKAACGAMPGTIVDGEYYYNVRHSGVWRYSGGSAEKILSAYWEDGWMVNGSGLYYKNGKTLYRMDTETLRRKKIYTAGDGTHIGFDLADGGNVIVTVYDKRHKWASQVLIDGMTGEILGQLAERIPYDSLELLYTNRHFRVGDRQIELVPADGTGERFMPNENGAALLPEGSWVGSYDYTVCEDIIYFGVYSGENATEESGMLMLFADGTTIRLPRDYRYSGAVGHILLYVDNESAENYGKNGAGIWCLDPDSGERWQLETDADCDFYAFVNDDSMLYSCVPWEHGQTAWQIVQEGARPVLLRLADDDITDREPVR